MFFLPKEPAFTEHLFTRIVCTVPSITEMLYDLGMEEQVVGITKFCVHPKSWHQTKQRIGGTKNLNLDIIKALEPTLIIANKEENLKEEIEALSFICPVLVSDIENLKDVYELLENLSYNSPTLLNGTLLKSKIETGLRVSPLSTPIEVLYLIWNEPFMSIGTDTFIHSMLNHVGLENTIARHTQKTRYPEVSVEDILNLQPKLILLSSEPFPFKQRHIDEIEKQCNIPTLKVDGEMFSWYGSRLQFFNNHWKALKQEIALKTKIPL